MDGMDAVLDAPEVEEVSSEVDSGAEPELAQPQEQPEGAEGATAAEKDDPYTTRSARNMRAALEAWKQANPEAAKFAKIAKDNYARIFALKQLEPKGIDGIRETYSLLDSVIHGDLKGRDALGAMQDALTEAQQVDELLASGDPRVLEAFGEEFNDGLARLAPAYMDRVRAANPEAFDSVVGPYVAETISGSSMVRDYNAIVDVLNTVDDPRLDEPTKLRMVTAALGRMGEWLNQQMQKGGEAKTAAAGKATAPDPLQEQRTQLQREQQTFHWENKIYPQVRQYVAKQFDDLFRPYQQRLKLPTETVNDMRAAFVANLEKAGNADAPYIKGINAYRKQGTPSPENVINFAKSGLSRHAKPVMESLVKARYGAFLNGRPKTQAVATAMNGKTGPVRAGAVGPGVEVRTVKPPMNEIDHKNTPIEWLTQKKYRLYSGKVVQVRAN